MFLRPLFSFSIYLTLLLTAVQATGGTSTLSVTPEGAEKPAVLPLETPLVFPGEINFSLTAAEPKHWLEGQTMTLVLVWPTNAPAYSGSLVWLKDRDDYWHQHLERSGVAPAPV